MEAVVRHPYSPEFKRARSGSVSPVSSFSVAIVVHLAVIFGWSRVGLESASYGIRAGSSSVEVTLIAAAPAVPPVEEIAEPVQINEVKKSEFVVPEKKAPEKPKVKPSPAIKAAAPVNNSSAIGSGGAATGTAAAGSIGAASAVPDYLVNPPPAYPFSSRKLGEEGTVLLAVEISPDGGVNSLSIRNSSGYSRLDEAALKAVRRWRFKPARIGGIAVSDKVEVPIRFALKN